MNSIALKESGGATGMATSGVPSQSASRTRWRGVCFAVFLIALLCSSYVLMAADGVASVYARDSRTIVIETLFTLDSVPENEVVSNYTFEKPTNLSVTNVKMEDRNSLVLTVDGNLLEGMDIALKYGFHVDSPSPIRSGTLEFIIQFIPTRPTAMGRPVAWGNSAAAVDVSGLASIVAVAAGNGFTAYLESAGTVIVRGSKCADANEWSGVVALAAREATLLGLRSDGTVLLAGETLGVECNSDGVVAGWMNRIQVAVGEEFIAGLGCDGRIELLGSGAGGGSYSEVLNWEKIVSISVTQKGVLGLDSEGTLRWDIDELLDKNFCFAKDVLLFSGGYEHFVYITNLGDIVVKYAVADPSSYSSRNLEDVSDLAGSKVTTLAAGRNHNLYLETGMVKARGIENQSWSSVPAGLFPTDSTIKAIAVAAGRQHSVVLLADASDDETIHYEYLADGWVEIEWKFRPNVNFNIYAIDSSSERIRVGVLACSESTIIFSQLLRSGSAPCGWFRMLDGDGVACRGTDWKCTEDGFLQMSWTVDLPISVYTLLTAENLSQGAWMNLATVDAKNGKVILRKRLGDSAVGAQSYLVEPILRD